MSDKGRCPLCGTVIQYKEYMDEETGCVICPACLKKFNVVNIQEMK